VYRCTYSTEKLGDRLFKPYKVVATGAWVQRLARKCKCPSHKSMVDEDEEGKKTGKADMLQLSAAYPPQLGAAVIDAWAAHSEPIAPNRSIPEAPDKFRARMSHAVPGPGFSVGGPEFAGVVSDGAVVQKRRAGTAPAKPKKKKEGAPDAGDPWSSVLEGGGGEADGEDQVCDPWRAAAQRQPHGEEDMGDPWATVAERRKPGEESAGEIHDLWAKAAAPPPTGRGRRSAKAKAGRKNIDAGGSVDDPWANASPG
jgi:hypothetical protein